MDRGAKGAGTDPGGAHTAYSGGRTLLTADGCTPSWSYSVWAAVHNGERIGQGEQEPPGGGAGPNDWTRRKSRKVEEANGCGVRGGTHIRGKDRIKRGEGLNRKWPKRWSHPGGRGDERN